MELFTSSSAGKVVVKTKDMLIMSCKCLFPPRDAQDTVLGTMRKTEKKLRSREVVPLLGVCRRCPKRYLGQKQRAVSCPAEFRNDVSLSLSFSICKVAGFD